MGKPDPKLLEMAEVFHIPKAARLKYIILPAAMPGLSKLLNGKKPSEAGVSGTEPAGTGSAGNGHPKGGKS